MKHNRRGVYHQYLHNFFQLLCLVAFSFLPFGRAQTPPVLDEPKTITVHTGRPLAEMLDRVQAMFLTPINYEEVPHESGTYLIATTIKKSSGARVLLAPPVVDFSVTFGKADSSAYFAALSVLQALKSAGLPGEYNVMQNAQCVDVVPVHVLAASGMVRDVVPVMGRQVTIPFATHRIYDVLQTLVDQLSRENGPKVLLLNIPFAYTDTIDFGTSGRAARDVIAELGAKLNRPISFRCLYDATEKAYYLNLTMVAPVPVPGTPASEQKTHAKPVPLAGPPDSPFFIKTK